ncbi:MAG: iron-sulfur cluster insertion protein ErpA [Proteobacteria bacterium]|nr:iron-sulfur cluster insertion protein ErpA [Pseudomonadota bacterium]MDA1022653.1 iron-sulfur cluster insertion protein ErpA [Pseudomonadota bacterium]
MPDGNSTQSAQKLIVTDSCAQRIKELREMESNPALMLRITISGGGCSGFQYGFTLDDKTADDDLTFENGNIKVVVDEVSLGLLEGSEVDFKNDLGGSFFSINNPNATANCGCGSSFSI